MPEIDVTDVLFDPDIAGQTFDVCRRREVVSNYGISQVIDNWINGVIGAVTPTGDNSLTRDEAYDAQMKSIKVATTFRLRGVSKAANVNYKPDLVRWRGDVYEVRTIDDFTQFGAGLVDAECIQIDYVGNPPQQNPSNVGKLDFSRPANSGLKGA